MIRLANFSDGGFANFWVALERIAYVLLLIGVIGFIVVQLPSWNAALLPQVDKVQLKGYFMHIDRLEVEQIIDETVNDDLLSLDLGRLETALEEMGWVKNAWISHFTPHILTVYIEEYEAVARWGSRFLVDAEGEIFQPDGFYPAALPLLNGEYGREKALLGIYRWASVQLETIGLKLKALEEDHRRSLRLILDNGVVLKLGTRHHQHRLNQFVIAWTNGADSLAGEVQCLDFRYLTGFAIGREESEC